MKITIGRNYRVLNLSATPDGGSPSARLAPFAFVVKFESKDFQIATKMRQPDRRLSLEVAFIAGSTGRAVQPVKPGGEHARSGIASNAFARPYLGQLINFGPKISLREKDRRSRCSFVWWEATLVATIDLP
jgi:hypothetical protein